MSISLTFPKIKSTDLGYNEFGTENINLLCANKNIIELNLRGNKVTPLAGDGK